MGVLLLFVGGFFSLAIPLTGAIELLLGWLYTLWKVQRKQVVLTLILIANVFTSLGLSSILATGLFRYSFLHLLIGEGLIWLVEAAILYLPMRKSMRLSEALLVSLVLNAVSFGVGLLLPF